MKYRGHNFNPFQFYIQPLSSPLKYWTTQEGDINLIAPKLWLFQIVKFLFNHISATQGSTFRNECIGFGCASQTGGKLGQF